MVSIILYLCRICKKKFQTFLYLSKYPLSDAHFNTGRLLFEFNRIQYTFAAPEVFVAGANPVSLPSGYRVSIVRNTNIDHNNYGLAGLSCHIWSCHILSGRTEYDCNIWSGQNMTTNLLVIFRSPLQYFVRPTNSILRLPYHAWDHRISHNCKGRRNRSEFVIIFCPDQILQSYLVL